MSKPDEEWKSYKCADDRGESDFESSPTPGVLAIFSPKGSYEAGFEQDDIEECELQPSADVEQYRQYDGRNRYSAHKHEIEFCFTCPAWRLYQG
jgi:hypothetical protein